MSDEATGRPQSEVAQQVLSSMNAFTRAFGEAVQRNMPSGLKVYIGDGMSVPQSLDWRPVPKAKRRS